MKLPNITNRLYYVRIAIASALVIASVGLAFVAIKQAAPFSSFNNRGFGFEQSNPAGMEPGVPTALARKLARNARFSPQTTPDSGESPDSWAQQDWLEHSVDGADNGPPALD